MRTWWAEIAATCGARDDACAAVLVTYLREQPLHGAMLATKFSDPRLVSALFAVFDDVSVVRPGIDDDEESEPDADTVVALGDAIRACGADIGDARRAALAVAAARATSLRVSARRRSIALSGLESVRDPASFGGGVPAFDAPCVCLSGRTYGACCAALEAELDAWYDATRKGPRRAYIA
ncbi:MAG: SEC-C domain-containing protein [Planctomycetes bacterium]|nr:SEC-C domain-containing protein [Planctomycetota bacterium]